MREATTYCQLSLVPAAGISRSAIDWSRALGQQRRGRPAMEVLV